MTELLEYDLGFYDNPEELNVVLPKPLHTLLSHRSGLSEQTIHAMTLESFSPFSLDSLDEDFSDFHAYVYDYSILLPSNNHKKNQPKLRWKPWLKQPITLSRACPHCINDHEGIITLSWYLPVMLSCQKHQCFLQPCSTALGQYVYWSEETETLNLPVSSAVMKMDHYTWSAITTGQVKLPRRTIHAGVWFRLLRTLLNELHMPLSYSKRVYTETVVPLWNSLSLEPRSGMSSWKEYEHLSFKRQQETLMVAAQAIEWMENKTIAPKGNASYLFLSEPIFAEDLLSLGQKSDNISETEPECSIWKKVTDSLNVVLDMARRDPIEAQNLRKACLFGRTDSEKIQEINQLLIECSIPSEFLDT